MELNYLIDDLLSLLDENKDIKKIKEIKSILVNDSNFMELLNNYKENNSIDNKKRLYENNDYLNYLKSETNINLLILEIKNKFNIYNDRNCIK